MGDIAAYPDPDMARAGIAFYHATDVNVYPNCLLSGQTLRKSAQFVAPEGWLGGLASLLGGSRSDQNNSTVYESRTPALQTAYVKSRRTDPPVMASGAGVCSCRSLHHLICRSPSAGAKSHRSSPGASRDGVTPREQLFRSHRKRRIPAKTALRFLSGRGSVCLNVPAHQGCGQGNDFRATE
jgi:hypothetical protein